VKVELRLAAKQAKRFGLPRVLARGTARVPGAGTVRVAVRPGAAARRKLKKVRRALKATLTTSATDAAGNVRTVSRTLRLSR
jgi:hypothetical protein